uniref:RING-type domain-containing protein n=1 Tax=Macrostomum lignano TaxID=282301 RepID=A0A1I8JQA4_9PLAT
MPNLLMMGRASTSDSEASLAAAEALRPAASRKRLTSPEQSNPASPLAGWRERIEAPPWESALTIRVATKPVGCSLVFVAARRHPQKGRRWQFRRPAAHLLQFLTCMENGLLRAGAGAAALVGTGARASDSFISGLIMSGDDADKGGSQANAEQSDGQPRTSSRGTQSRRASDFDDNMDFVFRIVMRESNATAEADPVEEAGSVFSWQESYSAEALQVRPLQSRLTQPAAPASGSRRCRQAWRLPCASRSCRARFYGWLAQRGAPHELRAAPPPAGPGDLPGGLGRREDYPHGLNGGDLGGRRQAGGHGGRSTGAAAASRSWRKKVWPVLLGFHSLGSRSEARAPRADGGGAGRFENLLSEWGPLDAIVRENDRESWRPRPGTLNDAPALEPPRLRPTPAGRAACWPVPGAGRLRLSRRRREERRGVATWPGPKKGAAGGCERLRRRFPPPCRGESIASSASQASNGGVYSGELIDSVTANWHRIDKDVDRWATSRDSATCWRPCWFALEEEGLTAGLLQPPDEARWWRTFREPLRLRQHRVADGSAPGEPAGHASRSRTRSCLSTCSRGETTQHFYFCYRWFAARRALGTALLWPPLRPLTAHSPFPIAEFCYKDVCLIWDTIWSASHLVSKHFNVFVAMALLKEYRGVIIEKRHGLHGHNQVSTTRWPSTTRLSSILESAHDLADQLVKLVENR